MSEQHVGRKYPPTAPYLVTAVKIAEFATALGDDNPSYFGDDPIAPPTFAVVIAFDAWDLLFNDPELDVALRRVLHGDQRFDFVRPLRDGDVVTATLTIDKYRSRGASEWITLSILIATTDGEEVCTATSTLLHNREEAAA